MRRLAAVASVTAAGIHELLSACPVQSISDVLKDIAKKVKQFSALEGPALKRALNSYAQLKPGGGRWMLKPELTAEAKAVRDRVSKRTPTPPPSVQQPAGKYSDYLVCGQAGSSGT